MLVVIWRGLSRLYVTRTAESCGDRDRAIAGVLRVVKLAMRDSNVGNSGRRAMPRDEHFTCNLQSTRTMKAPAFGILVCSTPADDSGTTARAFTIAPRYLGFIDFYILFILLLARLG